MELILASASPRRRELLSLAGYDFTVEVSDAEEVLIPGTPQQLVEHLAFLKAEDVARKHCHALSDTFADEEEKVVIIGSDTVVAMDGEILGKPADEEDAFRMLSELSGKTHQVYTGVAIFLLHEGKINRHLVFSECTDVTMRKLDEEEIRDYIACGEPMDKAGAYGIQGKAAVFISGIHGDYYNVVGLPICRLKEIMKSI